MSLQEFTCQVGPSYNLSICKSRCRHDCSLPVCAFDFRLGFLARLSRFFFQESNCTCRVASVSHTGASDRTLACVTYRILKSISYQRVRSQGEETYIWQVTRGTKCVWGRARVAVSLARMYELLAASSADHVIRVRIVHRQCLTRHILDPAFPIVQVVLSGPRGCRTHYALQYPASVGLSYFLPLKTML